MALVTGDTTASGVIRAPNNLTWRPQPAYGASYRGMQVLLVFNTALNTLVMSL